MDFETTTMRPPVCLSWTDVESGEELRILVHGPPEFLDELREEGFRPGSSFGAGARSAACVVVAPGSGD